MQMKSIKTGTVIPVKERKIISDFLSFDRIGASEALISLDDDCWKLSSWFAYQDGTHLAMALMFKKLIPTPVLMIGTPNCLTPIIRQEVHMDSIRVECPLSCLGILKERYHFDSVAIMNKMHLDHFRHGAFSVLPQVRRLTSEDFPLARDLYYRNVENEPFDADQYSNGIYFGIQVGNDLVSMAGTLVYCPDYRTVTIGNVITDPQYRHKGYATSVLIRLCQTLREANCDCVCIKVNRGNSSAISIYRRIGFVKKIEYFEGTGKKK